MKYTFAIYFIFFMKCNIKTNTKTTKETPLISMFPPESESSRTLSRISFGKG